ncbi:DUF2132 domain-containing protein [Shewanella cyperi]|uniref:DUF2132 domain-containing protein n=1 Tax=Shewanella cyperi TaxID=2814292 RepID=A0A974XMT8_9GAMM|nr:VF530 family protein [Shewanella cyperi]QSX31281.1 DUF2132 domain-containing protein [Shewanella cyperi]
MSEQPKNPLHGLTLKHILEYLVAELGWPALAQRIAIRCFSQDPSIKSSLTFLRRTPWAREKVEHLYLECHGLPVPMARVEAHSVQTKHPAQMKHTAQTTHTAKAKPADKEAPAGKSTTKPEHGRGAVNADIWGKRS